MQRAEGTGRNGGFPNVGRIQLSPTARDECADNNYRHMAPWLCGSCLVFGYFGLINELLHERPSPLP